MPLLISRRHAWLMATVLCLVADRAPLRAQERGVYTPAPASTTRPVAARHCRLAGISAAQEGRVVVVRVGLADARPDAQH